MIQTILDDLGIEVIACKQRTGPNRTRAVKVMRRIMEQHGEGHMIMVLRTITESEGNSAMLTEPIMRGISKILLAHPQWGERGLAWIEAFDNIDLKKIAMVAKANRQAATKSDGVATMLYERLQPIFNPPKPPRVRKPYVYKRGPRKPMQAEASL